MSWKFNPFTGTLDWVGSSSSSSAENFSYKRIASGVSVTIPLYQQMMVTNTITVDGDLIIDGEIFLLEV